MRGDINATDPGLAGGNLEIHDRLVAERNGLSNSVGRLTTRGDSARWNAFRAGGPAVNDVVVLNGDVTNGGQASVASEFPYVATIRVRGVADMMFHAWNTEAVEAKARAAKNSTAKKTDDLETFVYRNEKGILCVPGEYLRGAIILASKFKQDPRSPRKSAMDLFRAAVVSLTPLASLGVKKWDYEDRRRVVIQRAGITRVRPAMRTGWECEFRMMVTLPEYVDRDLLQEVASLAGRIGGLGDYRPTYGRFTIVSFKVSDA